MSYPIFESKEERNAWVKERRAKNVNGYGTNNNIGTALLSSLKTKYAYENARYVDVHSATVQQIYNHLESQFTNGMNWKNRGTKPDGTKGWQIDHRKPKCKFLCGKKEELYMCWHWTNLQPMWAQDNYEKGCYFDPDTFEYEWKGVEIGWSHKIYGKLKKNEENKWLKCRCTEGCKYCSLPDFDDDFDDDFADAWEQLQSENFGLGL